jgi:hypothetical protein
MWFANRNGANVAAGPDHNVPDAITGQGLNSVTQ